MDAEKFLVVLRRQYHDFLNFLQVISGLVEMNRLEKLKDYLQQKVQELNARGQLAKLDAPEIALVLIRFQTEALEEGIVATAELDKGLGGFDASGLLPVLEIFHKKLREQAQISAKEHRLYITGRNNKDKYELCYRGDFPWRDIRSALLAEFEPGFELVADDKELRIILNVTEN